MRWLAIVIGGVLLSCATLAACGGTAKVVASPTASQATSTTLRPITSVNPCVVPDGMVVPTPGFDPLTATGAELRAQDFPPRPRPGEGGLAAWEQYARWYMAGQVYRCGTARVPQTSGVYYGVHNPPTRNGKP